MPDLNPERIHIGRALREHRNRLGVSDQDMLTANAEIGMLDVRFAENAQNTSLRMIRWYHDQVIVAYQASAQHPENSIGEREQWWTTRFDYQLWDAAISRHRGVFWWWNPRKTPRGTGAYCYLCDTLIYTYDIGRGVTHNVRLAVMEHRAEHYLSARPGTQSTERTAR